MTSSCPTGEGRWRWLERWAAGFVAVSVSHVQRCPKGQFGAGEPWGFGMPNRVEPFEPDETLWIEARYLGTRATLTLEGEFDMTGTRALWAHVNDAIKSRFDAIIVDAGGLKFIDSSGLLALIRAREAPWTRE